MTPRVSVLMSVYNGEAHLAQAIESILGQTFSDFELVAINDGSTDRSSEILDQYARQDSRVRVFHQTNAGLGASLNKAAREARGEYLARQDADDRSAATRLARQVAYLDRRADTVLCGAWTWFIDPQEGPQSSQEVPDRSDLLIRFLESGQNPIVHGSVMFRHESYLKLPVGYRLSNPAQDYDLWLRLLPFGRLGMLESVEYFFWLSDGGISYSSYSARQDLVNLILKLHHQRKQYGHELVEDVNALELEIINAACAPGVIEPTAEYTRALHFLRIGNIERYRREMSLAAGKNGALSKKARMHLKFSSLWPLISLFYRLRTLRSPQRFVHPLPESAKLPDIKVPPTILVAGNKLSKVHG